MVSRSWWRPLFLLAAIAAILLACGSDDDPSGSGGNAVSSGGAGGEGGGGGISTGGSASGTGGSSTGGSSVGGSATGGGVGFECSNDPSWPLASESLEGELVDGINAQRALGATCGTTTYPPLAALALDATLRDLARCWAKSMGDGGWFGHTDLDGVSLSDVVAASAYGKPPVAAPISMGQTTGAEVLAAFMPVESLCDLVMHPTATAIGVGHYEVGNQWVVLMGD